MKYHWREDLQIESANNVTNPYLMITVSAALYAVIAGFAVTVATIFTFESFLENVKSFEPEIMFLPFSVFFQSY